eukprot:188109-Prymnesium_polylepis.1
MHRTHRLHPLRHTAPSPTSRFGAIDHGARRHQQPPGQPTCCHPLKRLVCTRPMVAASWLGLLGAWSPPAEA